MSILSNNRIELVSFATGSELIVDRTNRSIIFNEKIHRVHRETIIEVIWCICAAHPEICSYGQIMRHLNEKSLMIGSDEDVARNAQKAVNYAREFVRTKLATAPELFQNVTSAGYCLKEDNWAPKDDNNTSQNDWTMRELERLVRKYCDYTDTHTVIQDKSNLSYIKPSQRDAVDAFREINVLYWDIIERSSRVGNAHRIIVLREKMFKMLTYFAFWRVGDQMTDEKWKSDYRIEITHLLESIKSEYDQI